TAKNPLSCFPAFASRSTMRHRLGLFLLLGALIAFGTKPSCFAQATNISFSAPHGFSTFSSPFTVGSNTLSEILTNVPDATIVYRYSQTDGFGGGAVYQQGLGWYDNDDPSGTGGPTNGPVLPPGTGAFIFNNGLPFTVTLSGAPITPNLPVNMDCGQWYFIG